MALADGIFENKNLKNNEEQKKNDRMRQG